MQYLIDAHVLVWGTENLHKLGAQSQKILANPEHQLFISSFSLFELKLKSTKKGVIDFPKNIEEILAELSINTIGFDLQTIRSYKIYNASNKDPFDNLMISLALQHNLCLLTADQTILRSHVPRLKVIDASS